MYKRQEYYKSIADVDEENTIILDMVIYDKMESKVLELADTNTKIREIDEIINKYQSRQDKLEEEMESLNNEIEEMKKNII